MRPILGYYGSAGSGMPYSCVFAFRRCRRRFLFMLPYGWRGLDHIRNARLRRCELEIRRVTDSRKQYMPLLLLADESEKMVEGYLDRGIMFVIDDDGVKGECIVTDEGDGVLEIKNIAVYPEYAGRGYGRALIEHLADEFPDHDTVLAGTGDSPLTVPFYEKCGFRRSHAVRDFFIDNYDHPIIEGGVQLVDMVYFRKDLRDGCEKNPSW